MRARICAREGKHWVACQTTNGKAATMLEGEWGSNEGKTRRHQQEVVIATNLYVQVWEQV